MPAKSVQRAVRAAAKRCIAPGITKTRTETLIHVAVGGRVEIRREDDWLGRRHTTELIDDQARRIESCFVFDGSIRKMRVEQVKTSDAGCLECAPGELPGPDDVPGRAARHMRCV